MNRERSPQGRLGHPEPAPPDATLRSVHTSNLPALFVRQPEWSPIFDMDADRARAVRRRLFDMAATERLQIAAYHFPFPATGHIIKQGNAYDFVPVLWSAVL